MGSESANLALILHRDLVTQKYTDIEINLEDPYYSVKFCAHKLILESSSKYFDSMFNFGDGNKNLSSITIPIDNARIAHDVILSFYGQKINSTDYPDWKYLLETFLCRDFFCLENDVSKLYYVLVPADGFDLLLDVADKFDFMHDAKLMETIKVNIPIDYDLKNLRENCGEVSNE